MFEILLGGSLLAVLLVWWVARNRLAANHGEKDQNLRQLEAVLKSSQLTNDSFFRSLELVQKNLEALLARAESAEQRIRNLMLQPGMEKREQYTAAALLLGEGQEPRRVASMLNLPLPQVEIVQELQRMGGKEKKANLRGKRTEAANDERDSALPTKVAARREKTAEPILLVDVIKRVANGGAAQGAPHAPFGGVNA